MDVEYSFSLNALAEDTRSPLAMLKFLIHARLQLAPRLRVFTFLMMQPIRIEPHTRLVDLPCEAGVIPPYHDFIEGQDWNPGLSIRGIRFRASSGNDGAAIFGSDTP